MTKVHKVEKVKNVNARITSNPLAHLQTMEKTCAKFQKRSCAHKVPLRITVDGHTNEWMNRRNLHAKVAQADAGATKKNAFVSSSTICFYRYFLFLLLSCKE